MSFVGVIRNSESHHHRCTGIQLFNPCSRLWTLLSFAYVLWDEREYPHLWFVCVLCELSSFWQYLVRPAWLPSFSVCFIRIVFVVFLLVESYGIVYIFFSTVSYLTSVFCFSRFSRMKLVRSLYILVVSHETWRWSSIWPFKWLDYHSRSY
jgi:hypothetical protein